MVAARHQVSCAVQTRVAFRYEVDKLDMITIAHHARSSPDIRDTN
jgi:hypothetical protein